jgi:Ca2+-binding RTX toxin-like protein
MFDGGKGTDRAIVWGTKGNDAIKGNSTGGIVRNQRNRVRLVKIETLEYYGLAGDDSFSGKMEADRISIFAGPGDDKATCTDFRPMKFYGGEGDDTVNCGAKNDVLIGGPGKDTLNGGGGNDKIRGGADKDKVDGGTGMNDVKG